MPSEPIVIAHRGASGYLPEHSLAAKAMAHAMGAHFLEQDIVLSKDGVPLVLHDPFLDAVTDVARVFPGRARDDGRHYAVDFTSAELESLSLSERTTHRFPKGKSFFRIATLGQEIELLQGLNRTTGRTAGIYTEIKLPSWHRREGRDVSRIVLDTLAAFGYAEQSDPVFVQCFDWRETRRIREELGYRGRLVQLIGENDDPDAGGTDFDFLRTAEGLAGIAAVAEGIGPAIEQVIEGRDDEGRPRLTGLAQRAHDLGLSVHPYTLRADDLPPWAASLEDAMQLLFGAAHVDGVFTDFPDRAVAFLNAPRKGAS